MLVLDHLAVGCTEIGQGVDWVQQQLGVTLQPGGQHLRYGTHNMLLGLADGIYLEVIAKDPDAAPFDGPTWFGLDDFTGPPRLGNWICGTDDLDAALAHAPATVGSPRALERGDLRWQITVPDDGSMPYGGAYPTLIQWAEGTRHPAARLADSGCRLTAFVVTHPEAATIAPMIDMDDPRVAFRTGPAGFSATFDTPHGQRTLT